MISAGADPGSDFVAVTGLGESIEQALNASALGEKAAERAEKRIAAARVFIGLVLAAEE